jgi:hypothetical protein
MTGYNIFGLYHCHCISHGMKFYETDVAKSTFPSLDRTGPE